LSLSENLIGEEWKKGDDGGNNEIELEWKRLDIGRNWWSDMGEKRRDMSGERSEINILCFKIQWFRQKIHISKF
jgi:hypothetical protein